MEKEDKQIKKLLENEYLEKAPEGFTNRVMLAVEQVDLSKKSVTFSGMLGYLMLMLGAILVAFGILFYFDNDFVVNYFQYFSGNLNELFLEFSKIGNYLLSLQSYFPSLSFLAGIFLIVFALLTIDRLLFNKRNYANIFV